MRQVNIADIIAPSFDDVFWDIQSHDHTFYWLAGGRGSTKSSFISVVAPTLLLQNPKIHMVVLRKVAATIKTSVYPQIQWGLDRLGIADKFLYKISPPEITYKPTGQKILFFGVDDPQKIKSIKLPFGYIGVVWFEELDAFCGMEEVRNVNQSLLRGGDKYWEFCSYNPPKSMDSWVNGESLVDDRDRLVHHSDYRGVPRDWLGAEFIAEAEKLKIRNELLYRHEYLGEITGTGGAVFENVRDMRMADSLIKNFDRCYYGLDFGFAVDPLAFLCMYYDKKHGDLYIYDEIYQPKLSNKTAYRMIAPKVSDRWILADSAEPKSIAEMRSYGLHINGVKKGPDSVAYGIKFLQDLNNLYIDKKRCPNAYREFASYEYERNREGQFISAFPDKNNHAIDAARYGLASEIDHKRAITKIGKKLEIL